MRALIELKYVHEYRYGGIELNNGKSFYFLNILIHHIDLAEVVGHRNQIHGFEVWKMKLSLQLIALQASLGKRKCSRLGLSFPREFRCSQLLVYQIGFNGSSSLSLLLPHLAKVLNQRSTQIIGAFIFACPQAINQHCPTPLIVEFWWFKRCVWKGLIFHPLYSMAREFKTRTRIQ